MRQGPQVDDFCGSLIYLDDDLTWRYLDTGEPYEEGKLKRPCQKCGKLRTKDAHDPCIANLPGVKYACCGHGVSRGYAMFDNGFVLRGEFDHLRRIARKTKPAA